MFVLSVLDSAELNPDDLFSCLFLMRPESCGVDVKPRCECVQHQLSVCICCRTDSEVERPRFMTDSYGHQCHQAERRRHLTLSINNLHGLHITTPAQRVVLSSHVRLFS